MKTHKEHSPSERRRFERVDIAQDSQVIVMDADGKKVGVLLQIGRGGFMTTQEKTYSKDGKTYKLTIHEPGDQIEVEVSARVVYVQPNLVGFEFVDLSADAAVDVGIIIGKYYEAGYQG